MNIIKAHSITLYGSIDEYEIVLRPLCDDHLPYLYKWGNDLEVLYWTDGTDAEVYTAETVHDIYGRSSQSALCFIIEANGVFIGECWLARMYPKRIADMHPANLDVRRIDMMIGEKAYWNKGIGTTLVKMLAEFAFDVEHADVLHGVVFEYNLRSRRIFEKNGFRIFLEEPEEVYYRKERSKMTKEIKARELFAAGYNCAQAVLGVFCENEGLDINTAFKLANGFGGGIRCGEVCGAVSGAVMVVGLKCGFCVKGDFKQKGFCNKKSFEFIEKFKQENGSILCRDLLGVDIRSPEDHNPPEVQALHKKICPEVIAAAVRILEEVEF
ncbi:MAG: GNAT family N-acetyltransferase [Oscillospiraceae bacterium]|nr:GNAT family N-acetyltransferase [Oscillospiraceae bacterium]